MRNALLILLISINTLLAFGQNLVPNPSFEEYNICYCAMDGPYVPVFNTVKNWITPTKSSPDFDHLCYSYVPLNMFGYQYAKSGNGYVDFDAFNASSFPQYREYIEVELTDSLLKNKKYCVSFYISLCDSSNYAVDNIGLYFSDTLISENTNYNLPFIPQIQNPHGNFLTDKINWFEISGDYMAHGGEKFITIGNFYDDSNTDTIHVFGGAQYMQLEAMYYIDDVSVYLCDTIPTDTTITDDIYIPNIFSPNGDLNNDVLYVRSHNIKTMDFCIYNRWGEKVFESKDINKGWDGRFNGSACNAGVFVYYLNATLKDDKQVVKKGNITLIR